VSDAIRRVLVKCPRTGVAANTIFRLRASAFEALRGEHGFRCERCGEIHFWRREDAWLEGEKEPPEPARTTPAN
jgi:uncharacterized C2H2 Zn-finger protein